MKNRSRGAFWGAIALAGLFVVLFLRAQTEATRLRRQYEGQTPAGLFAPATALLEWERIAYRGSESAPPNLAAAFPRLRDIEKQLADVAAEHPRSPDARIWLARARLLRRDYDGAAEALDRAPDSPAVRALRARALYEIWRRDAVRHQILAGEDEVLVRIVGREAKDALAPARTAAREAAQAAVEDPFCAAMALLADGKAAEAIERLRTAPADDPDVRRLRADALFEVRRFAEAMLEYRACLQLRPGSYEAAAGAALASAYASLAVPPFEGGDNRPDPAEQLRALARTFADACARMIPDDPRSGIVAAIVLRAGLSENPQDPAATDRALEDLERRWAEIRRTDPNNPIAVLNHADVLYARARRRARAEDHAFALRAVDSFASSFGASGWTAHRFLRARILLAMVEQNLIAPRDLPRALQDAYQGFEAARARHSEDAAVRRPATLLAARAARYGGNALSIEADLRRAIELYTEVLASDDASVEAWTGRADARIGLARITGEEEAAMRLFDDAVRDVRAAAEREPGERAHLRLAAAAQWRRGDWSREHKALPSKDAYAQALQSLNDLLGSFPADLDARWMRAQLRAVVAAETKENADIAAAREDLDALLEDRRFALRHRALRLRGEVAQAVGDIESARADWQKALDAAPEAEREEIRRLLDGLPPPRPAPPGEDTP
jgi:tetratricopeptide (TPR) repeat protein